MRILHYRDATPLDPTLFLLMFSAWSAVSGGSLLLTDDAFDRSPVFAAVKTFGLPEDLIGLSMEATAMILLICVGLRPSIGTAVAVWLVGTLWFLWSILLLMGSWQTGFYTAAGAWGVMASFVLMRAPSHVFRATFHQRAHLDRLKDT